MPMTLDSWLADVAVKQKNIAEAGSEGHSVFEIFLLSPLCISHFFTLYKLQHVALFIFF